MKRLISIMLAAIVVFTLGLPTPTAAQPNIRYVDADATTGDNNGSSWEDAFTDLQDALSAGDGDEIWVAEGTYKPTDGTNRYYTFNLKSGVALYGGFAGYEDSLDDRDWVDNQTVLSGDIGIEGDASDNSYHVVRGNVVDNNVTLDGFTITGGNADGEWTSNGGGGIFYYWNTGNLTVSNCIIESNTAEYGGGIYNEGFEHTLILNNSRISNNTAKQDGGGICHYNGTLTVNNSTITYNSADRKGGGIAASWGRLEIYSSEILKNTAGFRGGGLSIAGNGILQSVTISQNTSTGTWGLPGAVTGGGVDISGSLSGNMNFINVTFEGNTAASSDDGDACGGAIRVSGSTTANIINSIFEGNTATSTGYIAKGGAIFGGKANIINSIFKENTATSDSKDAYGGAIAGDWQVSITNSTIVNNTAKTAGGAVRADSPLTIKNCILWGNTAPEKPEISQWPRVSYSLVQGGHTGSNAGPGIISDDPLFVDEYDDLRLDYDDTSDPPAYISPAIDAGNNDAVPADKADIDGDGNTTERLPFDLDGNPRIQNGTVDMGAYESDLDYNWAPEIRSVSANPAELWPPNGKDVDVFLIVVAKDRNGPDDIVITYSVSDEYWEYNELDTPLPDDGKISLVASRDDEDKDGRIYTIVVTVSDSEYSVSDDIVIIVPHDRRPAG